jgi:hypothetical protein
MPSDLLDRPGDTPSEREEANIARIKTRAEAQRDEIHLAIRRADHRQQWYLSKGDMRSAEIEGMVKDRRLDELSASMTIAQQVEADKIVAEKYPAREAS